MRKNKKIRNVKAHFWGLVLSLLLYSSYGVNAADTLRISLDDSILLAVQQSPQMKIAQLDSLAADGRWRVIRGERLPQISLSQDIPSWQESSFEQYFQDAGQNTYYPVQIKSGNLRWIEQLNVNQDLPWGATLRLSSEILKREWYSGDSQDLNEYSWVNRAVLTQPILNGNPVGRAVKAGKLDHEMALIDFEMERRSIIYSITQAFYSLVSSEEALSISAQDVELGRSSEMLAERKLGAGLIPEVDLLQIQVDLARREGSYRQTQVDLESARERFILKLGIPYNQPVKLIHEIDFTEQVETPEIEIEGETLDEMRQRKSLEKLTMQTRASIWSDRVQASLQTYYEVDKRDEAVGNLDLDGDKNVGVNLHFEIPIFGFGSTSGKIQELRAVKRRAEINLKIQQDEIASELRQAVRSVDLALDRIDIAATALDLSVQSHKITEDRFDNGLVDSRDLLDSQLELTRTRREALSARIDFELALANLIRIAP